MTDIKTCSDCQYGRCNFNCKDCKYLCSLNVKRSYKKYRKGLTIIEKQMSSKKYFFIKFGYYWDTRI